MYDNLHGWVNPRSELGEAWGDYLSSIANWDWWLTLTFRDPVPDPKRPGWNKPGYSYAKKGWREALGRMPAPAIGTIPWVRAFEVQKWRGAPHIHALVGGLDSKRYAEFGTWWWQEYGYGVVEEYDPNKKASYYLCKYVSKTFGDIEFSNHFPVVPHLLSSAKKVEAVV